MMSSRVGEHIVCVVLGTGLGPRTPLVHPHPRCLSTLMERDAGPLEVGTWRIVPNPQQSIAHNCYYLKLHYMHIMKSYILL